MAKSPQKVSMNFDVAKDLIDTKQEILRKSIQKILDKWGVTSTDELIVKTRSGELEEGEHDAIVITNYLDELKQLESLLK